MTPERAKIIARIRALRAKRVDAGATEHEAIAAAELAAKLMAQYQVAEDAVGDDVERYLLPIKGVNLKPSKSHPFVFVSPGVAHVTGCRIFTSNRGIYVVGNSVGREVAHYLFDMVRNVIDAAWKRERVKLAKNAAAAWIKSMHSDPPPRYPQWFAEAMRDLGYSIPGALARRSFGVGVAHRMSERMLLLPAGKATPDALAARAMADKELMPQTRKPPKVKFDAGALHAGAAVGNSAPISLGIKTEPASRLLIGSKPGGGQ